MLLTDDREIEDGVGVTEDNSIHRPEFHAMNEPIRIGVAVDVIAHLFAELVIDLVCLPWAVILPYTLYSVTTYVHEQGAICFEREAK